MQSGDATAAQTAFNTLVALGKTGPYSNGAAFQRSDRAQAFNAIGTALQAGDLAGAQQAFANLVASFGEHFVPKEPPTPAPPTIPNPVPEIIINLGGTSNNNTTPEVVINIGTDNTAPVSTTPPATSGILTTPAAAGNTAPATTSVNTTPELVVNIGSGNNSTSNTPGEIQINFGSNNGSLSTDLTPLQGNQSGEQVKIDFTQGSTQNELIVNLFSSGAPSTTSNNQLSLQA